MSREKTFCSPGYRDRRLRFLASVTTSSCAFDDPHPIAAIPRPTYQSWVRTRAYSSLTTETRLLLRVHVYSYWPWAVATEALSAPLAVSARL